MNINIINCLFGFYVGTPNIIHALGNKLITLEFRTRYFIIRCDDLKFNISLIYFFKDHSKGFGGKYGVQTDRVDQSAAGYDSKETMALHSSQTDSKKGFGGKFGVEEDRRDQVQGSHTTHEQLG